MTWSCTVLLAVLVAQPPDLPPFVKTYSHVATYYYTDPDPNVGPKMLKELLKKENLEHAFFVKNEHVLTLIGAQLGDIATGKPEVVREYEAAFADAAPAGRKVIIRALGNCGDKETVKQVDAWIADKKFADHKADLEALKKHLEDPKRQHVRDRPATTPKDLDLLWANFFVTGEYAPVSRILDVFDVQAAKENEVLNRAAKWSLGSNLQQHPKLVELVQKHAKDRPEGSKKVIDELIITVPKGGK
ncbi:MAG TPA: hypothetical protein VKE40_03495 [Gemmataceae bacterium]|nr:hypothetical protein [Gemmataceae bacterium]